MNKTSKGRTLVAAALALCMAGGAFAQDRRGDDRGPRGNDNRYEQHDRRDDRRDARNNWRHDRQDYRDGRFAGADADGRGLYGPQNRAGGCR